MSPVPATIAALASGADRAGIAVIRVSGPAARDITRQVIGDVPEARRAAYRSMQAQDGSAIDYGLALFFPAPGSFTGEDVLELQGHGGPVVVDTVLARLYQLGARPADAGEFSRRAFENDQLSLDQAEATADLIAAESQAAATAALRSLDGEFATRADRLTQDLTAIRAWLEGALDFPDEEDVDWLADGILSSRLEKLHSDLLALMDDARQGARLRDGLRIAILGRPNAGKSSLLNRLACRDSAIVTSIPGTTRDVVDEDVELGGLMATLVDTAGLRESDNPVEIEGMQRARHAAERANHILYLYDATEGLTDVDRAYLQELPTTTSVTYIANKTDLIADRSTDASTTSDTDGAVALSAETGDGIDVLISHLVDDVARDAVRGAPFSARRRHLNALTRAEKSLQNAESVLLQTGAAELAAQDLAESQACIGEITGHVARDDLLGEVFATFCIGK